VSGPVIRRRLIPDMPEEKYHAHAALSSTGARLLLDSPARFDWAMKHPAAPRAAFDLGHAVHSLVLGVGSPVVEIPREKLASNGAVSTTAAREFVAKARAEGKVPLKPDVYALAAGMTEAILGHKLARLYVEQEGHREASVFSTDRETGIRLRARFDMLPTEPVAGRLAAVDIKHTAKSANPSVFAQTIARLGYDVQYGHYKHTNGDDRLEMLFVVVEPDPPHLLSVVMLDREFAEIGEKKAARARRLFAEATASKEWAGYGDEIAVVPPPVFHIYDFQDNHEEGDK
jgi:hypothetical protein